LATQEEIRIIIKAAAEQAIGQLDKLNSSLGKQKEKTRTLGDAFKGLKASYLAYASVLYSVWKVIDKVISATSEQEAAVAQLNAVIASTGGAAGMTSEQVQKMATAMQMSSIYSDEAVISSSALLMTFTKIGEKVFPQAQQAILDLSTVMGGDLQNATIQIGKALQDPVQGANALRRAGVHLSEDQKNLIKTYMDANDVMSAQKVILGELATQFYGQAAARAKTLGGQIAILKNVFGDLFESGTAGEFFKGIVSGLIRITMELELVMSQIKGWVNSFDAACSMIAYKALDTANSIQKAFTGESSLRIVQSMQYHAQEYKKSTEAMIQANKSLTAVKEKQAAYEKLMATDTTGVKIKKTQEETAAGQAATQEKIDRETLYQQWAMDAALQWEADRYNQMSSFEKAMYELKRAYRNFDVANYQTYSNFMMNSLNKKNKAEFAVYKGFAIVQATMDTHKAAVAAYAAMAGIPFVGPVLAAAAAATAVALGMRNVANIAKMQPPKAASGGYIPGSPGGTHLIAGEGGRGEAILPLENSEAMDKIRGAFSGVTINLSGNIFARDDWPREIVMKIDRELYKLKQDRRSALFS